MAHGVHEELAVVIAIARWSAHMAPVPVEGALVRVEVHQHVPEGVECDVLPVQSEAIPGVVRVSDQLVEVRVHVRV